MASKKRMTVQDNNSELSSLPCGLLKIAMLLVLVVCAAVAGFLLGARADDSNEFVKKRQQMVDGQIKGRGIVDQAILRAMVTVPRHLFVADYLQRQAYIDGPLPIGHGQTISQPSIAR